VAALFAPAIIFLIGPAGTLGWFSTDQAFSYDRFRALASHGVFKIVLFVVITLPMFHWAHRFRFVLADLGLRRLKSATAVVCYAVALAVTTFAAVVLWNL
jgi:fumarate reductase subunit D